MKFMVVGRFANLWYARGDSLIVRPKKLKVLAVELNFNFKVFNFLEIDLIHVNKDNRSKLLKEEVAIIVISLINEIVLGSVDVKEFGEEICSYFVRSGEFNEQKYKLVFCICSDRSESIGVITLHRVR